MERRGPGERAVSPVVGTLLLVGIVVVLGAVAAVVMFGLAEETDAAPTVVLDGEPVSDSYDYRLVHGGGERLDGDDLELRGAADPRVASGRWIGAGDAVEFYPTSERVTVVWRGDDGSSYELAELRVAEPLPVPDEDCGWVDDQTDGHTDPITVDGTVVDCDVATDGQVTVRNGGVVVGEVVSDARELDADDATVYGSVDVEKVLNLQTGTIRGDATSRTGDAKVEDATVGGAVVAETVAEVTDSTVAGNVRSRTKDAKVFRSDVEGSVTANGTVKLEDATVAGDVYVDASDFDCTNTTIGGTDCGSYSPRDPSAW